MQNMEIISHANLFTRRFSSAWSALISYSHSSTVNTTAAPSTDALSEVALTSSVHPSASGHEFSQRGPNIYIRK